MSLRRPSLLGVVCITLLVSPACVLKLADRNAPETNGGVTGVPADCNAVKALPGGAPGGAAEPKFIGRFVIDPPANPGDPPGEPRFDWSGNYITLRFQGTDTITVKLQQDQLEQGPAQDLMFEFAVDDLEPAARRITVKNDSAGNPTNDPQVNYDITGLDRGTVHEVVIHKNTEAQKGAVTWKGFDLHGGTLLPPTRRARRIELIGDSIICGYGNEGKNATCPFEVQVRTQPGKNGLPIAVTVPLTENNYLAFGSIAGRALDADVVTTCWSGKGVYLNFKERVRVDPANPQSGKLIPVEDDATTMPTLWETRTLATDYEDLSRKYDFTKEKPEDIPQVVVISLGTNDFARDTIPETLDPAKLPGDNIPDENLNNPAELENFFARFNDLVKNVRKYRPDAHIFLATPPMVTDQFPLDNARRNLRATLDRIVADRVGAGDFKVYAMDLVEQGFRYGLGCDYHPNLEVHRIMATQLIGAIKSKLCW